MNYLWFLAVPFFFGVIWGLIDSIKKEFPHIKQSLANGSKNCILFGICFILMFFAFQISSESKSISIFRVLIGVIGLLLILVGVYFNKTKRQSYNFDEAETNDLRNNVFSPKLIEINNDISNIDGMEGHEFEYYCAGLLEHNGFSKVSVTPGSGAQGVDIVAIKDGMRYAIQCKNYATPLSNKPIQEVFAGKTFYDCQIGVVMTNSTFTSGAIALAKATGILLWDRTVVQQLMYGDHTNI